MNTEDLTGRGEEKSKLTDRSRWGWRVVHSGTWGRKGGWNATDRTTGKGSKHNICLTCDKTSASLGACCTPRAPSAHAQKPVGHLWASAPSLQAHEHHMTQGLPFPQVCILPTPLPRSNTLEQIQYSTRIPYCTLLAFGHLVNTSYTNLLGIFFPKVSDIHVILIYWR